MYDNTLFDCRVANYLGRGMCIALTGKARVGEADGGYEWVIQVTYNTRTVYPPNYSGPSYVVPTAFVGVDDITISKLDQPQADDVNNCGTGPIVLTVKNAPAASANVSYTWYSGTATGPTSVLTNYGSSTYTINPRPAIGLYYYWCQC